jgi:hypothetical protein
MTYVRIQLEHPDGMVEEFDVRISPQGVQEWLRDRDSLRASGRPDRPPDVDTPTLRAWVQHPGEQHPFFARRGAPLDQLPEAAVVWHEAERKVTWLMQTTDEGYHTEAVNQHVSGAVVSHMRHDYPIDEPEAVELEVEALALICDAERIDVTTPTDYELARLEYAAAVADLSPISTETVQ